MTAATREPEPGDRIGPYQLMRRITASGMGTVFLACYPSASGGSVPHGQEPAGLGYAAVKLLKATDAHNSQLRERFKREVGFARRVPRFCTAPVLEADLDADLPWVATEYIDAETLKRRLETRGTLSGDELHRFALGTAVALSAVHESGVIHRDLKPSNVLLSREGPRIIDFGIARDATEKESTFTQVQPGTPHYMAPEQVENRPVMTRAVDVFAWAGLVTAAAIGRPPFPSGDAPGPQAVMAAIVREEPDLADLREPLRGIVTEALDKDPAARPSAAGLVWRLAGMGPWADGAPPQPRPATAGTSSSGRPPPPGGWTRRRTLLALAGGVVAAGAAGTVVTVSTRASSAQVRVLEGHTERVDAVAVGELRGEPIAVSASRSDGTVRLWDLASGAVLGMLDFPELDPVQEGFRSVAVGRYRGTRVAVLGGSPSHPMRVWDLDSGEEEWAELALTDGAGAAYEEAVSTVVTGHWEGGPVLVAGGWHGTARMWDLRDGHQIGEPVGARLEGTETTLPVAGGELDGGPIVVTGMGTDGSTGPTAWRPDTGERVTDPPAHRSPVAAVAVGALDGQPVVLSGSEDTAIRIWDLNRGNPAPVGQLSGPERPVRSIACGAVDGSPVAVAGGDDQIIRVWNLTGGEQPRSELAGHTSAIRSVALSEVDGNPVAVSGGDQTVRVWPLG